MKVHVWKDWVTCEGYTCHCGTSNVPGDEAVSIEELDASTCVPCLNKIRFEAITKQYKVVQETKQIASAATARLDSLRRMR